MPVPIQLKIIQWYKDPSSFFRDLYHQEPFPYQARVLSYLPDLNLRRILILSAAGTGKSKLLACIALWLALVYSYYHRKKYDVVIVSGSAEQSRSLYEYSAVPLKENDIFDEVIDGEVLKTITRFKTKSVVRALPLSLKAIQGKHVPAVIIDEAALVDDFTINDTYRIVGGFEDSLIILSGTPMEYTSKFVEMWLDKKTYPDYFDLSEDKRTPTTWARFTWSAMDCPRFTEEEIEEARRNLTEEQFRIFWEGIPYPVTNTVVPIDDIRKCSIGIHKFRYDPSRKNGKVIFGIDYGYRDLSVIVVANKIDDMYRIIDVAEWNRTKYENIQDWIEAYAMRYRPDYVFVDLNPKGESQRTVDRLRMKGIMIEAVDLAKELGTLQVRMKTLFEKEKILVPEEFQPLLNELRLYTWDKRKGDDRVTALMLSLRDIEENRQSTDIYYKVARTRRRPLVLF